MTALPGQPHSSTPRELQAVLKAEQRQTPFLLYRDGEKKVQHIVDLGSSSRPLTIGRRADCDIALPWDQHASGHHAVLDPLGEDWAIVDRASRNGTFVNTNRIVALQRLDDGDLIGVGGTLIRFRDPLASHALTTTMPKGGQPLEVSPAQTRVLGALCGPLVESTEFAVPASNRQIADQLQLSNDTVKGHMRALFEIFQVGQLPQNEKRARLAQAAMNRGVVPRKDRTSGAEAVIQGHRG